MPALLVILLVVVPLAELVVILRVSELIGGWWTIALLVADSLLGAWLLRREGRRAWAQFREALADSRWPGDEVTQGGLIIVGGALLLTPGFLTDVVGFLMLLPPTRALLSIWLRSRLSLGVVGGTGRKQARRPRRQGSTARSDGLDIEVVEIRRDERPTTELDDGDDPPDGEGEDRGGTPEDRGGSPENPGGTPEDPGRGG